MELQRILIANEDDETLFRAATLLLESGDYEVDAVTDGFAAVQKLQDNDYGLVILDLLLPRVNGFDLIQMLPTVEHPPVVIVLTELPMEKIRMLNPSIVRAIIQKPIVEKEFLDAVRAALGAPRKLARSGGLDR